MVWLLVAAGGGLGAVLRHAANLAVQARYGSGPFPFGIFVVNVVGCVIAGLIAGLLASGRLGLSADARAFVFVGILGGFTTFSAFGLDTLTLAQGGHFAKAAMNVVGQVGFGLAAVWIGYAVAATR